MGQWILYCVATLCEISRHEYFIYVYWKLFKIKYDVQFPIGILHFEEVFGIAAIKSRLSVDFFMYMRKLASKTISLNVKIMDLEGLLRWRATVYNVT